VVKIGLVAPFEGIYRQVGYEALAAMRVAIDESETGPFEIMPLALDSGIARSQARRAMQKLLIDPSVRAVIGPFSPEAADAVSDLLDPQGDNWFLPFLPSPTEDREHALATLIATIADQADENGETSLVLAGWSAGWPDLSAAAWSEQVGRPVRLSSDPREVTPTDTIIWLGGAVDGADYLIQLRSAGIDVPVWLAVASDMSIFYPRVADGLGRLSTSPHLGPVYWTAWLDDGYERWAATHSAIAEIINAPSAPANHQLYSFQLSEDGQSLPLYLSF
jgi:branched-chain amino acid transport system substrate-binding protein